MASIVAHMYSHASASVSSHVPQQLITDLPSDLLSLIFASAAAPLTICKASTALSQCQQLVATWLVNSGHKHPLLTAAHHKQWGACMMLAHAASEPPCVLHHICSLAAQAGQLDLVAQLLSLGAWAAETLKCDQGTGVTLKCDQCKGTGSIAASRTGALGEVVKHPLPAAAAAGHTAVCALILEQREVSIGLMGEAFRGGVRHGHLAVVQLLVTKAPALSDPRCGRAVLCIAAEQGHLDVVQFLLDRGADPHNRPGTPWSSTESTQLRAHAYSSPVVAAAGGGNPAVLQLLVDRGAVLECCWHEALAEAAKCGKVECVRLLLTLGDSVLGGSPWQEQWSPDSYQVEAGQSWQGLQTWQEQGCWIWARLGTPLNLAAGRGHAQVVQLLLESGRADSCGCKVDALAEAARMEHVSVMQLLLQHGACASGGCGHQGHSDPSNLPLFQAIVSGRLRAVQLLMTAGSASAGVAELEYAARMGHLDIVRHLVELGVRDTEDSALVAAAMCARQPWPIMELLLAAGKAAEASSSEPEGSLNRRLGAALIAASGQGRAGLVEQLLEYQRGERAPDSSMPPALSRNILDTALCAATMASREFTHPFGWSKPFFLPSSTHARQWIISMLVERGADVEAEPSAAMRAALKARDGKMTARLLSERRAVPQ